MSGDALGETPPRWENALINLGRVPASVGEVVRDQDGREYKVYLVNESGTWVLPISITRTPNRRERRARAAKEKRRG